MKVKKGGGRREKRRREKKRVGERGEGRRVTEKEEKHPGPFL